MTTAQPFPYSKSPKSGVGRPRSAPPPSLKPLKGKSRHSGQAPDPKPDSNQPHRKPDKKRAKSQPLSTLRSRLLLTLAADYPAAPGGDQCRELSNYGEKGAAG